MKPKKPEEKKRSIFHVCFPCFGKPAINCDEIMYNSFGKEFTEYEYVIENLAIRRAPKKLLDVALIQYNLTSCQPKSKKNEKDFSGNVCKKVPPAISVGPVIGVEDASPEDVQSGKKAKCEVCGPHKPSRTCATCKKTLINHAEISTDLDDSIIREILNPHIMFDETKSAKMQVYADIHRGNMQEDIDKPTQMIPTEIQQTIEALKVAKPLHLTSEFPSRNHRSLIRSVSTTSCDKETFCNFIDRKPDLEENKDEMEKSTKLRKKPLPSKRLNRSSPSTSDTTHFPDIIECEEIENTDLQTTAESTTPEPEMHQKAQSLKWKIIINKHKKR